MAYEMKEGRGSLWQNEKKATDTHPDQTGSFLLNGKKYNIAVWKDQKSKDGTKTYDSLSISEWKQKDATASSGSTTATPEPVFEGDVPF